MTRVMGMLRLAPDIRQNIMSMAETISSPGDHRACATAHCPDPEHGGADRRIPEAAVPVYFLISPFMAQFTHFPPALTFAAERPYDHGPWCRW